MNSDTDDRRQGFAAANQQAGAPSATPITPMRRQTIGVQIHALLRREIIAGRLLPRATLSEQDLSQRFGVSRTPVREALIKLAEENLVETYPQYGSFVSPIKLPDVFDSQFVREAIECAAIERAIGRVNDEQIGALKKIMERQGLLESTGDEEGFFLADEQLHAFILDVAGHAKAWRVVENAKAQLDRVRFLTMRLPKKMSSVVAEHSVIVDRFIARDSAGAVEAMRTHLRGVFRSIEILEKENPGYFADKSGNAPARAIGAGAAEREAALMARERKAISRPSEEPA
jgi:GntR family transcriptional regulator, rspAB operon transcriptional repressor